MTKLVAVVEPTHSYEHITYYNYWCVFLNFLEAKFEFKGHTYVDT